MFRSGNIGILGLVVSDEHNSMGSMVYKRRRDRPLLEREFKSVVSCAVAHKIRSWAAERLREGASSEGAGDSIVRTIYLDTDDFDVFRKRRSYRRSKYRIRQQGDTDTALLGRRLSRKSKASKRETAVGRESLEVLPSEEALKDWEGYWFHRRLLLRQLRPVCQVSFLRTERVAMSEYGPIRLVIDRDFRALPLDTFVFDESSSGQPFLEGRAVVKLTYPNQTPAVLKHLIEEFALSPKSASKYRLGAKALGIVPEKRKNRSRKSAEPAPCLSY